MANHAKIKVGSGLVAVQAFVTLELRKELERRANEEGRSMSGQIRWLIGRDAGMIPAARNG